MSWIIFALLAAGTAALVAIFAKLGLGDVDTTLATTLRSIVMAVLLVLVSAATGKLAGIGTVDKREMGYIALAGLAGALSWLCYFLALRNGPATGVAALDRLSVVFVFVLAVMFLGEPLTLRAGLGAAMMVIGALLMLGR